MLWNSSEEDLDVKSEYLEDGSTECEEMETVTLIGKGTNNLTCLVYYAYKIKSKIFSLSVCFFPGE
jgi:hypothetical protein